MARCNNFGKMQNVGGTELSEEENLVFNRRKISYFVLYVTDCRKNE